MKIDVLEWIIIGFIIVISFFAYSYYQEKKQKERFIELSIKDELTIEEKKELFGIIWDKNKPLYRYLTIPSKR